MRLTRCAVLTFCLSTSVGVVVRPARAQGLHGPEPHHGPFVSVGVGGTDAGATSGIAATAGGGLRSGVFLLTVNVADLTFSHGDTGPYYTDTFSNGQSRCRNSNTGQFASSGNCSAASVDYAASADLNVFVPRTRVFLGAGARVGGDHDLGYGSIGAVLGQAAHRLYIVRVNIGADYVSGLVQVGFQLP